ncbi:hypothetical protein [Curtobacterium flaccumfaciens]|uniref:hypothetical protein n=1 Tax=Curtobacterium flaccumfaciens TaxID=2035 RepID=UPI001BDE46DB|nr:hypothetical protein [Curtobacterium flaccumfaciens]MBT1633764.1 hypothetical protein [Curtobacterium flaccumfaciens pv. oortii]MCX2845568.1 hypothetical protein [Curtobacterium flaccumfaciens pv. oortii]
MADPTTVEVKPFVLSNFVLAVAAFGFQKAVSQCEFQPQGGVVSFKGGTPDAQFTFATTPTWQLVLAYAQDWTSTNSLARFLFDHQGETVDATFTPLSGGPVIAAKIVISAGPMGGTVDAVQVGSVTLGVVGKPTIAAAAAGS